MSQRQHADLDSYLRSSNTTDSTSGLSLRTARPTIFRSCLPEIRALHSKHTMEQVATSHILKIRPFLLIRLAISAAMTMTLVLFTATTDLQYTHFSAWVFALVWATSLLLCSASLRHLISPESSDLENDPLGWLPNLTIPLRLAVLCSSAVIDVMFWLLLRPEHTSFKAHTIIIHIANFVFPLIDFLLATPTTFPFFYVLLTALFPLIWVGYAWINFTFSRSWSHPELDFREGAFRAISIQAALVLMPVLIALSVFFLNEISTPVVRSLPSKATPVSPATVSRKASSTGRRPSSLKHPSLQEVHPDSFGPAAVFMGVDDENDPALGPFAGSWSGSSDSSYVDFDKYVSSQEMVGLNAILDRMQSVAAPMPVFVPITSSCHVNLDAPCRRSHSSTDPLRVAPM